MSVKVIEKLVPNHSDSSQTNLPKVVNKPWFLMLVGLTGSGKTSFIQNKLIPHLIDKGVYSECLSVNDIIDYTARIKKLPYNEVFKDIIDAATLVIEARMYLSSYMGMNIILDGCNTTTKGREKKLKQLYDKDKYFKIALVLDVPSNTLYHRNADKPNGKKAIETKVLTDMITKFETIAKGEDFDDVVDINEFTQKYMIADPLEKAS